MSGGPREQGGRGKGGGHTGQASHIMLNNDHDQRAVLYDSLTTSAIELCFFLKTSRFFVFFKLGNGSLKFDFCLGLSRDTSQEIIVLFYIETKAS